MRAERELDLGIFDQDETKVENDDDLEDTFRSGPPGGMAPRPSIDEEPDTGEMLAAVETDAVLDDAGPTAKTHAVPKKVPVHAVRVVERARVTKVEPARPERDEAPQPVEAKPIPAKIEAKKIEAAPRRKEKLKYNPFQVEDPPAVGVDPAIFPIHQSAPQNHLGQRIILGLVGALVALISIAFVAGSGETPREKAIREAREEYASRAAVQARIDGRRHQMAVAAAAAKGQPQPGVSAPVKIDRESRIRRPKVLPGRERPKPMVLAPEPVPYAFTSGAVAQPKKYGDRAEHVAPPGTGPMLIVMSQPQALVLRDGKLFGATPLLVPVEADTQKVTVTLRNFGYKDKTIDLTPGPSGNLEASVVLEKDPAFEGFKVVSTEKPRDKS